MSWYIREPQWLQSELTELKRNSSYREVATNLDRCLVSSGYIVTRLEKAERYPVLFVYPDATPYVPPTVFFLNQVLAQDEIRRLSTFAPNQIAAQIQKYIKLYNVRHQNSSGSLCILDADDLHSERPEIIGARATILRVRDWLVGVQTGRFPMDSHEVELFYHFPKTTSKVEFLIPDEFFETKIVKGNFFMGKSCYLSSNSELPPVFYFGLGISGPTESGIIRDSFYQIKETLIFAQSVLNPIEVARRSDTFKKAIKEKSLIEGWWWDIQNEPQPFATVKQLAQVIGNGNPDVGIVELVEACKTPIAQNDDYIYIGLRFPGRRKEKDWQMFRLVSSPKQEGALIGAINKEELKVRIVKRTVEAIHSEYVTESYFHLRNSGRCERQKLAQRGVTCIGVGALGSTIADLITKGGIGRIHLVDKGSIRAHNVIRHTAGITHIGMPKVISVGLGITIHNPFVSVIQQLIDITSKNIEYYFPSDTIGISTVADDNIEAFLNDQAIRASRIIFYARSLRGGKVARIFRVQPGVDACKECLALYHKENAPPFVPIEEDESLLILTNECNNPVRPGSGADLGVIGSIIARLVLDYLQEVHSDTNHWIWTTEQLEGIDYDKEIPYALYSYSIKPHPKCRLCQRLEPKEVLISEDVYKFIKNEASKSNKIETGGILMGFRSELGNIVVTRVSGPGPKAIRRKDWFERDCEFCQQMLEEAVVEIGNRGQYVGEWHYHPTGSNHPSGRDLQSLTEIAMQTNYATDEPILIIISPELEFAFTIHPANKGYVATIFKVIPTDKAKEINLGDVLAGK